MKMGDSSFRIEPHTIPQFIFRPAPLQLRSSILIRKEPVAVVSVAQSQEENMRSPSEGDVCRTQ